MTCEVTAGSIYKLLFPFTDPSQSRARPALALAPPDEHGDVRFAFITTVPPITKRKAVELSAHHYQGNPLPFRSFVRLDKIFLLPREIVIKPLARLADRAMAEVYRQMITLEIPQFYGHANAPQPFVPGQSTVPVSGRVYGPEEIENLVESALDFWLTAGRFNEAFEKRLAEFLGVEHVLTTNSGSSANLLATAALTSPKLGEKRLKAGDEVITVAAAFPTTVNPLLQYGLIPVFVDVDIPTYNIRPDLIDAAVSDKTRAILLAHMLGNPFDLAEVLRVAHRYDLWFIEDCCDALGSRYTLPTAIPRPVGSFGHLSTFSFYPAHHITMGEGGAVATNDDQLRRLLESFRDWGRDCWCPPGHDNTCKRRFDWHLGDLPKGYDHKYSYSHIGYNLKITDMQAAVGLAQMARLKDFIQVRKRNFRLLKEGLRGLEDLFILPELTPNSDPAWFGFPITLREGAPFDREDLLRHLNEKKIATRLLFSGNLLRQPYFQGIKYRVVSMNSPDQLARASALQSLPNTDIVMNRTFWLGIYPGLTEAHVRYIMESIRDFVQA